MTTHGLEADQRRPWLRVPRTRQGMLLLGGLVFSAIELGAAAGWIQFCGLIFSATHIGTYPCGPDDRRLAFIPLLVLPLLIWGFWKRYDQVAREAAERAREARSGTTMI